MFIRTCSTTVRFCHRTSKIPYVIHPSFRLGLDLGQNSVCPAASAAIRPASIQEFRRSVLLPIRTLCTSTKDVDKVNQDGVSKEKDDSILKDFHMRAKRPSKTDRWILVFMGRYKSDEDIPDFVSDTVINNTKNKFRILVNIGMGVFALLGGIVMIYIGRKRMTAGESITGINMERRKDFYQRSSTENK